VDLGVCFRICLLFVFSLRFSLFL
jgi:hypothetical protein